MSADASGGVKGHYMWIVQLRPASADERYLTLRGKGVTTERSKAKVFTDETEAEKYVQIARDTWPDSKLIQVTPVQPEAHSETEDRVLKLEAAARAVASELSAVLSLGGRLAHHGHNQNPGTCGPCRALNELKRVLSA